MYDFAPVAYITLDAQGCIVEDQPGTAPRCWATSARTLWASSFVTLVTLEDVEAFPRVTYA